MSNYIWGWHLRRVDVRGGSPPSPLRPVNPDGEEPTIEEVVELAHLLRTYERLRREAGQAAGADGIGYDQMGRKEAADVLREKRSAILQGRWRPDPTRRVRIRKVSGGYRTLCLPTIADRILHAGLNDYLTPFWQRRFLDRSHGFRPARSRFTLLAHMDTEITATGRTVLVVDDIRRAFDSVRLVDCLAAHRQFLCGEELLAYIFTALRGHDPGRTTGIDQGSPYCPTALNVLLHVYHDLPLERPGEGAPRPWYRYADNLIYLTTGVSEGRRVRQLVSGLVREAGLVLKGNDDDAIIDIHQRPAEVLGLTLRMADGHITYTIPDAAWTHLDEALVECHHRPNPPMAARTVISGWIEGYGPALEHQTDATLLRLRRTATRNGHRELADQNTLAGYARDAFRRWQHLRAVVRQQIGTERDRAGTTTSQHGT